MEKERAFFVNVGGMNFDLYEFDDMPEDVRAALDEMGNQLVEEFGEKNVRIEGKNVSPEVNAWVRRKIEEIKRRNEDEGPDAVKVKQIDREWYNEFIAKDISQSAARIDAKTGGKYAGKIAEIGVLLAAAFRILTEKDEDWRELGCYTGAKLYSGVAQALMIAAAARKTKKEREADGDEA